LHYPMCSLTTKKINNEMLTAELKIQQRNISDICIIEKQKWKAFTETGSKT
jgi:hypothetical protein